jgi:hypothetical protein
MAKSLSAQNALGPIQGEILNLLFVMSPQGSRQMAE